MKCYKIPPSKVHTLSPQCGHLILMTTQIHILEAWSSVVETVWEELVGMTLLEELYHWGNPVLLSFCILSFVVTSQNVISKQSMLYCVLFCTPLPWPVQIWSLQRE